MPLPHLKRTIEVSTPGTKLSVRYGQLIVERPDVSQVSVPMEEIGVLLIDDIRTHATQRVYVEILKSGGCVVVNGIDHLPVGMMMPIEGHSTQVEIQRAQISLSRPFQKRMWQSIVTAKIRQQSQVLHEFCKFDLGLNKMAKRVLSGDTSNMEAQAAQKYWPALFGKQFRRRRSLPGTNALLNYGYAIIRAAVARAVVASGLLPSIGIHHHNRSNTFSMADDLIEPFRPFVDWRVKLIMSSTNSDSDISLDDRSIRANLLALLNERTKINGTFCPLSLAIGTSATALRDSIVQRKNHLMFPEGLPERAIPISASRRVAQSDSA